MSNLAIHRPENVMPRPALARVAHSVRNVAPRVSSLLPGVVCRGPARDAEGRPLLYLTFDDGPDEVGTPTLLDALARAGARATFFVLASRAARDIGLVRAIVDAGHGVGNHGWRHLDAWRERGAARDLERGERWLQDALGLEIADVRPPYGHLTPAVYHWARRRRRRVVLWDAMPGDYEPGSTPSVLADALASGVRAGSIVVMHDGAPALRAAAALKATLPQLRDAGWHFRTL